MKHILSTSYENDIIIETVCKDVKGEVVRDDHPNVVIEEIIQISFFKPIGDEKFVKVEISIKQLDKLFTRISQLRTELLNKNIY